MIQQPLNGCPCCGYRTGCTTCPVCVLNRCGHRDTDTGAVTGRPNGEVSLRDARRNFSIYRASHRRYRDVVRPSRSDELP
ncbi:hypothetical protein HC031_28685 [Planosporangium thailandense]|uniref:Cysteine-rich CPCC domain-containing protein n=1 Tax=Planosporangium thailandense TaxID=765197 RepID=A0ABX0Y8B4_9ACTN|nr:hypothetical protein [Planosporangium thailandense]